MCRVSMVRRLAGGSCATHRRRLMPLLLSHLRMRHIILWRAALLITAQVWRRCQGWGGPLPWAVPPGGHLVGSEVGTHSSPNCMITHPAPCNDHHSMLQDDKPEGCRLLCHSALDPRPSCPLQMVSADGRARMMQRAVPLLARMIGLHTACLYYRVSPRALSLLVRSAHQGPILAVEGHMIGARFPALAGC